MVNMPLEERQLKNSKREVEEKNNGGKRKQKKTGNFR